MGLFGIVFLPEIAPSNSSGSQNVVYANQVTLSVSDMCLKNTFDPTPKSILNLKSAHTFPMIKKIVVLNIKCQFTNPKGEWLS